MTWLRFLRAWRIFIAVYLLANVTLLVLNAAAGNPFALFNAAGAACCLLPVVLATRTIRRRAEQMRPRPDYAAIARMERDIFGETFEHDGAPQVPRPQRQACGYGHPLASDGACKVCVERYRLHGRLPAGGLRPTVQRDRSDDDAVLIMLSGAIVRPGGTITLPSGEKIDSAEWARRGGRTS